jgi:hypothetical protein
VLKQRYHTDDKKAVKTKKKGGEKKANNPFNNPKFDDHNDGA